MIWNDACDRDARRTSAFLRDMGLGGIDILRVKRAMADGGLFRLRSMPRRSLPHFPDDQK